jgi:hypothetical protein
MSKVVYFFLLGTCFVWGGPCAVDFPIQSGPPSGARSVKKLDLVVFRAVSRDLGSQLVKSVRVPRGQGQGRGRVVRMDVESMSGGAGYICTYVYIYICVWEGRCTTLRPEPTQDLDRYITYTVPYISS